MSHTTCSCFFTPMLGPRAFRCGAGGGPCKHPSPQHSESLNKNNVLSLLFQLGHVRHVRKVSFADGPHGELCLSSRRVIITVARLNRLVELKLSVSFSAPSAGWGIICHTHPPGLRAAPSPVV